MHLLFRTYLPHFTRFSVVTPENLDQPQPEKSTRAHELIPSKRQKVYLRTATVYKLLDDAITLLSCKGIS